MSPQAAKINFASSSTATKTVVTPDDKEKTSVLTHFAGLRDMDIVCGRGAPTNFHIGNEQFRELVSNYHSAYFCAKRSDKPGIAMNIMEVLESRGARFVRRQKGRHATTVAAAESKHASSPPFSSHWVEVSPKIAYEKVCQALRDGTPEIQRKMLSSSHPSYGNTKSTRSGKIQKIRHSGEGTKDGTRYPTEEGKENGKMVVLSNI